MLKYFIQGHSEVREVEPMDDKMVINISHGLWRVGALYHNIIINLPKTYEEDIYALS